MFTCPVCQAENRHDAKFCRKCGQARAGLERASAASRATPERPASQPVVLRNAAVQDAVVQDAELQDAAVQNSPPQGEEGQRQAVLRADAPSENVQRESGQHESLSRESAQSPPVSPEVVSVPEQNALPDFSSPECPTCWTALRVSDKYCSWCGEPQPMRTLPYERACLRCSMLLPQKANFCHACGNEVTVNAWRKVRTPAELFEEEGSEFFPRFEA